MKPPATAIQPASNAIDASSRIEVSAVIVTHNRPQLLRELLAALRRQTRQPTRVIVVDNASARETQDILAQASVEVLRSDINLGGAAGFARGLGYALESGAQWIWLMDDDAIPEPTALEQLQVHLPGLPPNAGVVCSCVMEFGAVATAHRRRFNAVFGYERAVKSGAYTADVLAIDTASFVGFMVSADAVRAVGLPDSDFFLSYDDTEYSLRLNKAGFGLWLVPTSVIVHKRSKSGRLGVTQFGPRHYFNVRNRIIVKRKYCKLGYVAALGGVVTGFALWLRSPGCFGLQPLRMVVEAIADGFSGRLGPLPEHLNEG